MTGEDLGSMRGRLACRRLACGLRRILLRSRMPPHRSSVFDLRPRILRRTSGCDPTAAEAVMVPRVRTFLLILCLLMAGASAAMPSESSRRPYLALGDSVVFRLYHPSRVRICESYELHRIPGLRRARLAAE